MTSAIVFLLALFVAAGTLFAADGITPAEQPENSVRVTVGDKTITDVETGTVVHKGDRSVTPGPDGETHSCNIPQVRVRMSSDVSKVFPGLADGTCYLKVNEIVMNSDPIPTPDSNNLPTNGFLITAGWEWHVQSLAKVVSINSIDDLTKTYAWFDFKMADITGSGSVYDGNYDGGQCWAANAPQPPFYYFVDSCIQSATELEGPYYMAVQVDDEFGNSEFSWFKHYVESRAEAFGYEDMPDVFDADCYEEDVPYEWGADFECELY